MKRKVFSFAVLAASVVGTVGCGKMDASKIGNSSETPAPTPAPTPTPAPEPEPQFSYGLNYINRLSGDEEVSLTEGQWYPGDNVVGANTEFNVEWHCVDPLPQVYKFRIKNSGDLPINTASVNVSRTTDYTSPETPPYGDPVTLTMKSQPSTPIAPGATADFEVQMEFGESDGKNPCALGASAFGLGGSSYESAKVTVTTDEGNDDYHFHIFGAS